jgi:phosphatidylglycerol:prolipoprotein diacylglycerol transferase
MQGAVRQPVQLYSVFLNILLYLFLWRIYSHKKRDGAVLMAYCLCYPPIRFLLEFLRGDPRLRFLHLTSAQIMSIFIFLCGIALWKFLPEKLFRKQQTS